MSGILNPFVGGAYAAIPGAPTIGTAIALDTSNIAVPYTAPASNGGSTITSYTATSNPGGITGVLNQATSGTIVVSGLTSGTSYTFTVTATSSLGTSAPSAVSNSVTTYQYPSNTVAPVVSGATSFGSTLSCTTGTWTGVPASFTYAYQWTRAGVDISGATSSTYVLIQADVGNTIFCRVTASNPLSTSANSNTTAVITANSPNAPTIGTATVAGTTSATVTFTESTNNGGSAITSHYVFATPSVGGGQIVGNSPITATGLSPGTSYTFTIATNNGVGTSPQSASSNSITTWQVPANSVAPSVTGTATAGQTLTCSTGTWTGVPLSFTYAYQWKRGGSTNIGTNSNTYVLVSGDVGSTISCTVTATNSGGSTSANSNSTSTVISVTVPGAPTIGSAVVTGPTTASVSWTAPASDGGATITSYTAVASPGGTQNTAGISGSGSVTVTNLTPSNTYTFTVYATNSVGNGAASAASNSITTPALYTTPQQSRVAFGRNAGPFSTANTISNTGAVSGDTTSAGTARAGPAGTTFGSNQGVFIYGATGTTSNSPSNTVNLMSNTGVIAGNTTTSNSSKFYPCGSGYGADLGIITFGSTTLTGATAATNLISNTGVVASQIVSSASGSRGAAAGRYGSDKGIVAYGNNVSNALVNRSVLISNTGNISGDTSGVGTVRNGLCYVNYGAESYTGIFAYGGSSTAGSTTNYVSSTGVVAGNTTGAGIARTGPGGGSYNADKGYVAFGLGSSAATNRISLVSNTGTIASDTAGGGTARYSVASVNF